MNQDDASIAGASHPLPDGEHAHLRFIRPEDAPRLQDLAHRLSGETVQRRFFGSRRVLYPEEAARLATVDYSTRLAIVAERPGQHGPEIIGVARYDLRAGDPRSAELALLVEDRFQRSGLGRALLRALTEAARANGITRFVGEVLAENYPMLQFLRDAGFPVHLERHGDEVHFIGAIDASADDPGLVSHLDPGDAPA